MRGYLIATATVALLLAAAVGAAQAAPPGGFYRSARLAPAASLVAEKPVTVYCAYKQATIDATVGATAVNTVGATPVIGGSVIYLSPLACAYLNAWANGRRVVLYNFAVALETLVHEAELAAGVNDETAATCKGITHIPAVVKRYFPLKKRESLHDLMGDVRNVWMSQSAVYHAHPC